MSSEKVDDDVQDAIVEILCLRGIGNCDGGDLGCIMRCVLSFHNLCVGWLAKRVSRHSPLSAQREFFHVIRKSKLFFKHCRFCDGICNSRMAGTLLSMNLSVGD